MEKLTAKKDYFMSWSGEQFLTEGKQYTVENHYPKDKRVVIIDDLGKEHWLDMSYFKENLLAKLLNRLDDEIEACRVSTHGANHAEIEKALETTAEITQYLCDHTTELD